MSSNLVLLLISDITKKTQVTFPFPETQFIAVTAYQNEVSIDIFIKGAIRK